MTSRSCMQRMLILIIFIKLFISESGQDAHLQLLKAQP